MKNLGWLVDVVILVCVTALWMKGVMPQSVGIGIFGSIAGARVVVMRSGGAVPLGGSVVLAILIGAGYYLSGKVHSA